LWNLVDYWKTDGSPSLSNIVEKEFFYLIEKQLQTDGFC